jgi:hypothetical protein
MRKAGVIVFGAVALGVLALFLFGNLRLTPAAREHATRTAPPPKKVSEVPGEFRSDRANRRHFKLSAAYYEKRRDWGTPSGGKMNISTFAFRDINRNGIYDIDDYPMVGVVFELLQGPDNKRVIKRSNLNGFGNFVMSVQKKERADIRSEGDYSYHALTPPGWYLTTNNEIQRTTFKREPGSVGDMISSTPTAPVGFAQTLKISGRVQMPVDNATKVLATSPSGREINVPLDTNGTFQIDAEKGLWSIKVSDSSGAIAERTVNLEKAPVVLSRIKLDQLEQTTSSRTRTVHFDDLITTQSIKEIPYKYGGVDWRNWVATHNLTYGGEGYVNNTMSGEFVAYNSSGHPVKVFSDQPFDFVGGYFGVAWGVAEGETLRVEAWRGAELAYQDELELSVLGPVYFSADYKNVTLVRMSTLHYWQFVCDDITFGHRN